MLHEATDLIASHQHWLRSNTLITQRGEYVEFSIPFLDRRNDYIRIYLTKEVDGYILSDLGETIDDLGIEGFEITTPTRERILKSAIVGFGVSNEGGVLKVKTSREKFGCDLNNLVQAILSVNDLHFLAKPVSTTNFKSNVANWLKENFENFSEIKKFVGKSGLEHSFHFAVAGDRRNTKQVFKVINSLTTDEARKLVFSWIDTREEHFIDCKAIAILNDQNQDIPDRFNEVLNQYQIGILPWSKCNGSIEKVLETLNSR